MYRQCIWCFIIVKWAPTSCISYKLSPSPKPPDPPVNYIWMAREMLWLREAHSLAWKSHIAWHDCASGVTPFSSVIATELILALLLKATKDKIGCMVFLVKPPYFETNKCRIILRFISLFYSLVIANCNVSLYASWKNLTWFIFWQDFKFCQPAAEFSNGKFQPTAIDRTFLLWKNSRAVT